MSEARPATRKDVDRVLTEYPLELEKMIPVTPIQLSLPLDGRGPRIKVSVKRGAARRVPSTIEFELGHDRVRLALEACEDYQDFLPY